MSVASFDLRTVVVGRLGPYSEYVIALRVNLPPVFKPFVKLPPRAGPPLDFELVTQEALDRFMAESAKLTVQMDAIVDTVLCEWRLPNAEEQRRLDELRREFDVITAIFEFPLAKAQ